MKCAVLCLLLLPACAFFESSYEPVTKRYELTWYCTSPNGCERTQEVAQIHRATDNQTDLTLMSTQDPSFEASGTMLYVESLPRGCVWIYYLSLFGHELEPAKLCYDVGGWELELLITNADHTTSSRWVISGRDVRFL